MRSWERKPGGERGEPGKEEEQQVDEQLVQLVLLDGDDCVSVIGLNLTPIESSCVIEPVDGHAEFIILDII